MIDEEIFYSACSHYDEEDNQKDTKKEEIIIKEEKKEVTLQEEKKKCEEIGQGQKIVNDDKDPDDNKEEHKVNEMIVSKEEEKCENKEMIKKSSIIDDSKSEEYEIESLESFVMTSECAGTNNSNIIKEKEEPKEKKNNNVMMISKANNFVIGKESEIMINKDDKKEENLSKEEKKEEKLSKEESNTNIQSTHQEFSITQNEPEVSTVKNIVDKDNDEGYERCQTVRETNHIKEKEGILFNVDDIKESKNPVKSVDHKESNSELTSNSALPNANEVFRLDDKSTISIEAHVEKSKYVGTFINYDINIVPKQTTKNANKFTKCTRRYDNFKSFYLKLTRRYPYIYLPKLSSTKISINLISNDAFLESRKKELCYLLNYIYTSEELAKLPESILFINSAVFDEKYFKSIKNDFGYDIQIPQTNFSGMWNSMMNYFKGNETTDSRQMEYSLMYKYYNGLYQNIHKIKHELTIIEMKKNEENSNYNTFSNSLSYLKDIGNNEFEQLEHFEKIAHTLSNQGNDKIHKLVEKFSIFDLLFKGVVNLLYRYTQFCELYNQINKLSNQKQLSSDTIKKNAEKKKKTFEDEMEKAIKDYVNKYSGSYEKLIEEFVDYLREENEEEKLQINNINN